MKTVTTCHLQRLRKLMAEQATLCAAYIVPSNDAHSSEYLAERDQRRQFISGFTGSRGTALITKERALMWTDGRYFLQAEKEMDGNWTLMKEGLPDTPSRADWLSEHLKTGDSVGVDPFLITNAEWEKITRKLDQAGIRLGALSDNLVDKVWGDQPSYPENPVVPLELEFCGLGWEDKVADCRKVMANKGADYLVLSALDDVAWLLNLRGSDIQYNPVFFAYAVVGNHNVHLFVSERQVTPQVRKHLACSKRIENAVTIRPYYEVRNFLQSLDKGRVWFCSATASRGLVSLVPRARRILELSPVTAMKAIKNKTEIQGFENCHVRDASALCAFFAWLEKRIPAGDVDEISAAEELYRLRSELEHFVGLSFETISAAGPNAAVIHYRPARDTCRTLTAQEVYLVDSGAQYKDGTTDVTRTLHFGQPNDHERECFTRVLKGQIRMARTVFPSRISGNRLDAFARSALWEVGLDYLHGTGHGVGSYLNVHEGPSGISWRPNPDDPGVQEGMVFSDEPGYYEDDAFGIRLENLLRVVRAETKHNFKGTGFLTFVPLTLVPVQRRMIEPSLLDADEVEYINSYHEDCRERVGTFLRELGWRDGLDWLLRETETIG